MIRLSWMLASLLFVLALVPGRARTRVIDEIPRDGVADLVKALKDKDAKKRAQAAVDLGALGAKAKEAIPALSQNARLP